MATRHIQHLNMKFDSASSTQNPLQTIAEDEFANLSVRINTMVEKQAEHNELSSAKTVGPAPEPLAPPLETQSGNARLHTETSPGGNLSAICQGCRRQRHC